MKGGQNFRDLQDKKKKVEEEQWVKPQPCVICGKVIPGAYGHHGDAGWTCSASCERTFDDTRTRGNNPPSQG